MNGFGGVSMYGMYSPTPYGYGGMRPGYQQNQPPNDDPNAQEQQSFVEHLRTWISGLSAITGISYGCASLFRVLMGTLKILNIFRGKKETQALLQHVWEQSAKKRARSGLMAAIKFLVVGLMIAANAAVYFFIRHKRQLLKQQTEREQEEEKIECKESDEISIEDFMLQKKMSKSNYVISYF